MTAPSTPRERENEELPLRGGVARVRPVRPGDAALLQALFAGMGEESRRRRFFASKPRLTREELAFLTDVDHRDHEALIALDGATGEPVGVARYVRSAADANSAELAIAVADAHRRRGVAGGLIARLTERALDAGVQRFTGFVLGENEPARRLLGRVGATVTRAASPDLVEVELALGGPDIQAVARVNPVGRYEARPSRPPVPTRSGAREEAGGPADGGAGRASRSEPA